MAIVLYREGDSDEVSGVRCEIGRFPAETFHRQIAAGWVSDIQDLRKRSCELSDSEIKSLAKERGISLRGKNIATLKSELDQTSSYE